MKAIVNGRIVMPDGVIEGKALLYDEKIRGIVEPEQAKTAEIIDAGGKYVAPGLIDMHIHGYLGEDVSDGSKEGILKMAEGVVKNGVTSWLPTTMTVSYDDLRRAFEVIRELMKPGNNKKGAQILGVNAEGPFINPDKKGAQALEHIRPVDVVFLKEYADIIRVFTVAPEMPGSMEAIREIASTTDMLVSIGHTSATCAQCVAAFQAGAGHVTHLFNAMTPMGHREPGVAGAALMTERVSAELIADTFHISPELFELVAKLKGDKLVLITDCTQAGGLGEGEYKLGGQTFFVKGIECRLADGTIAGSVLKLNHAVRNFMKYTELPVWKIVRMASLTPAERIGVADRKGSLLPGRDADIILADDEFHIARVMICGEDVYEA